MTIQEIRKVQSNLIAERAEVSGEIVRIKKKLSRAREKAKKGRSMDWAKFGDLSSKLEVAKQRSHDIQAELLRIKSELREAAA